MQAHGYFDGHLLLYKDDLQPQDDGSGGDKPKKRRTAVSSGWPEGSGLPDLLLVHHDSPSCRIFAQLYITDVNLRTGDLTNRFDTAFTSFSWHLHPK